jgi:hypothetical protein
MPRTRWALTRPEREEYVARAKWLAAAGAAIEIPEPTLSHTSGLRISQYGPEFNDIVVNLHPGKVVVIVGLRLVATRGNIMICDCYYTPPWEGPELFLSNVSDERSIYQIARGLEFSRDEILNHRIEAGMSLRRGVPVEGVLIGTGLAPLPDIYCDRMPVSVGLTFIDQFDNEFPFKTDLRITRRVGSVSGPAKPSHKRGLFDLEKFNTENKERVPKGSDEVRLRKQVNAARVATQRVGTGAKQLPTNTKDLFSNRFGFSGPGFDD